MAAEKADKVVDACGLSCPQPALLTRQALASLDRGAVEVIVDSATARDNVARTGEKSGWQASICEQADGRFQVLLTK